MKPESLRGKRRELVLFYGGTETVGKLLEDKEGECFKFEEVKSAVGFYKRYSFTFNPDKCQDLIQEEQPEVWDKWNEYCATLKKIPPSIYHYDMWLFNYCFLDVIE